jgi:hypothetical protein
MTKSLTSEGIQWRVLASFGLLVPALILFARFRLPRIAEPFVFISLSGIQDGRDPHLFARIVHDLTHPVFLLCYAVVLTIVAARSVGRPLSTRSSQLLFGGLALIHLTCLVSYFIALFLPIGDMVSVISTR